MLLTECKRGNTGRISGFFGNRQRADYFAARGIVPGIPFVILQTYRSQMVVRFGSVVFGLSARTAMQIRVAGV